jgi:hypothetical protein
VFDLLGAGKTGIWLGTVDYAEWKSLIQDFPKRFDALLYAKTPIPLRFLQVRNEYRILFAEGVTAQVCGLPNASLQLVMRCLELAIKWKYLEIEGTKPDMRFAQLIDWAERIIGSGKETAHDFRRIRNYTHSTDLVKEQDSLEAIRHVSHLLNAIFPLDDPTTIEVRCRICHDVHHYDWEKGGLLIGNKLNLICPDTNRGFEIWMLP